MPNILLVDDEQAIADLIEVYLKNENFTVYKYYTGMEALHCIETTPIDLAILDIMLPDIDGLTICQKIRECHTFPILMLTAKDGEIDQINGFALGADDYITKPFRPLELIARVKANLRRATCYNQSEKSKTESSMLSVRGLSIIFLIMFLTVFLLNGSQAILHGQKVTMPETSIPTLTGTV